MTNTLAARFSVSSKPSLRLVWSPDDLRRSVRSQIEEGRKLLARSLATLDELDQARADYQRWTNVNVDLLKQALTNDDVAIQYIRSGQGVLGFVGPGRALDKESVTLRENLSVRINSLQSVDERIEIWGHNAPRVGAEESSGIESVLLVCERLPRVVRALSTRGRQRPPLTIGDEYDVQYLIEALLRVFFDDVRPEEWTPSYAGGSARMDFLLAREGVVVETKMTRTGLGPRQLGEQLIVDIERYRAHNKCKTLVCLVYDPEHLIPNARGIEADLARNDNEMNVVVRIVPTD